MSQDLLFSPYQLGSLSLKNRVVMSPMTRSRSIGNVPGELVATYYAQRAEAGLIITEGTSPSPNGLGYARIPGLFDDAQVAGWKQVTAAVSRAGTPMFVQLMHTGRVTHPGNLPAGAKVLAPSAVAAPGTMWVDGTALPSGSAAGRWQAPAVEAGGMKPFPVPTAMTEADIEHAIGEYVASAKLGIEAGFAGVELHGANGYLIEQFLNVAANQRTDEWGGSVDNRIRFAVEVAKRTAAAIGGARLGIRLSPYGAFNGSVPDADTDKVYIALAAALRAIGLVYIHIVDHSSMGAPPVPATIKAGIRDAFGGTIILAGGYDKARAEADLEAKHGELIAFARPFISNPKLVSKLRSGAALTPPNQDTFYTPGPAGYTDYE